MKGFFIEQGLEMFYRFLSILIIGLFLFWGKEQLRAEASKIVNVYSWAYVFSPEILKLFEEETGIKVNLDVYDSPEVMETKLFAGHSGYDVVMVTVWPYLPRQLEAHIYQPLDRKLIPEWEKVDADLLSRMEEIDPGNQFSLPYLWGTSGFAYNKTKILEQLPHAPLQSDAMLFDPLVVSRLNCGVMLIDSPVDVFPAVLCYLKLDPQSGSVEDLKKASTALSQVRSYIKKFQPVPSARDLTSGDYCLVEGFSGELLQAQKLGKEMGMEIEYVIPEEGGALWVDALAIPQDAPHIEAAHAFINFVLRPDIIAKITDELSTANSVPASLSLIEKEIRENPLIYPSTEVKKKLYVDKAHSPQYERLRLREWTRVKIGR
jgi:putrescine transport system substrate-binding protein